MLLNANWHKVSRHLHSCLQYKPITKLLATDQLYKATVYRGNLQLKVLSTSHVLTRKSSFFRNFPFNLLLMSAFLQGTDIASQAQFTRFIYVVFLWIIRFIHKKLSAYYFISIKKISSLKTKWQILTFVPLSMFAEYRINLIAYCNLTEQFCARAKPS